MPARAQPPDRRVFAEFCAGHHERARLISASCRIIHVTILHPQPSPWQQRVGHVNSELSAMMCEPQPEIRGNIVPTLIRIVETRLASWQGTCALVRNLRASFQNRMLMSRKSAQQVLAACFATKAVSSGICSFSQETIAAAHLCVVPQKVHAANYGDYFRLRTSMSTMKPQAILQTESILPRQASGTTPAYSRG